MINKEIKALKRSIRVLNELTQNISRCKNDSDRVRLVALCAVEALRAAVLGIKISDFIKDLKKRTGNKYSVIDCAAWLDVHSVSVSRALTGKRKTIKGYKATYTLY